MADFTDRELVEYVDAHSRTERALVHREHVRRLLTLAGRAVPDDLPEFVGVHHRDCRQIIEDARAGMKEDKIDC
jgi:hypothetical protein